MDYYWTAFMLGLVGSAHCAGMCGPLALALPTAGHGSAGYILGRIGYNLGRVLTYAGLGVVFGLVGRTIDLFGVERWLSISLGVLLLAGLFASRRLGLWMPVTTGVGWLKSGIKAMLRRHSFPAMGLLGLLNGLLPCGLVYAACLAAIETRDVQRGVIYMAVFGLGTVPLMLAISLSGRLVPGEWRLRLQRAAPLAVVVVAALLILRGLGLGIPYLSPDLSGGVHGAGCCHQ
jgi:hypothetical protein